MPSASARAASASISWRFSTMCAKGSPGSTWPAKVRNTGRVASSSLESVMTMSRIGCAPAATWSQTPTASSKPPAGGDDGGRARIAAWSHRKCRIGDDDRNVGAEPLAQRQSQRQPCKRAAADDNASLCRHALPLLTEVIDWTCYMTIAGRNRGLRQGVLALWASFRGTQQPRTPIFSGFRVRGFTLPRNDTKPTKALPCPKA